MVRLIASDMDGTLLNSLKKLHPDFKKVIKELSSRGVYFACASGRNHERLKKIFKGIEEDIIYISDNGNYIKFKDKVIVKNIIKKDVLEKLTSELRSLKGCGVSYSTHKAMYTESKYVHRASRLINFKNTFISNVNNIEDDVIKCSIICLPSNQDKISKYLANKFPELYVAKSGKCTIDINSGCTNKGVAIKRIQEMFDIKYEETMVFGDYLNDYEMMDSAYYSYAMENAHEKLKEKARFIAPKNTKNGVLRVIQDIVLDNKK